MTRNLVAASLLALLFSGRPAFAQFDGMDLSDDGEKKDEKKPNDGLDLSPSDKPTSAATLTETRQPEKKSDGPAVERDTTQDDRVKSVQRKLYLKRGRFELAPAFIVNINDAYYTKLGGSIRVAFYPADTLAISARFNIMSTLPTDDVRTAKRNLNSRIFFSEPIWSVLGDLEWSPFYGKVAIFNSILHFDAYLLGGGGIVTTTTSLPQKDAEGKSVGGIKPKPAFDLGVGFRFVARDFLAVNVSLTNTTYGDVPTGATKSITQNLMLINVGLSIFFPFKSTYREDE